jgi:hypothetical protein
MTLSEFTRYIRTWEFVDYLYKKGNPYEENESVTVNFIERGVLKSGYKFRNAWEPVSVFDQLSDDQLTLILYRINRYYRYQKLA